MKVLHVVSSLAAGHGGPSRVVLEMCHALFLAGVDVTLCTTMPHADDKLLEIDSAPYALRLEPSWRAFLFEALARPEQLRSYLASFDLVHIHGLWSPASTVIAKVARRIGVPYVLTSHGMLDRPCLRSSRRKKFIYTLLFERNTIEGAARLHLMNEGEAEQTQSGWTRLPPYFLAPNGINARAVPPAGAFQRRYPAIAGRPFMLYLGRLHPSNNSAIQLQVLQHAVRKRPDLLWVLIGPDQGSWPELVTAARSARLLD